MSINKKEYDQEGSRGVIYTLSCDTTGEKMLDILARDEDVENAPSTKINAKWVPKNLGSGSGEHELSGLLSYGPIDENSYQTEILDISADEGDSGEFSVNVYVAHSEKDIEED